MTWQEAGSKIIPFGKYKGKCISTIARDGTNPDGMLYLDWLRGQSFVSLDIKTAIDTYMNHRQIAQALDDLLD